MTQYTCITYHVADNNVFETCLRSLRQVSDCQLIVFTDNVPEDLRVEWERQYGVKWKVVPPSAMKGKRAAFKVKSLNRFACKLPVGSQVLAADVDLYFMEDPFTAFGVADFQLAVTTRGYSYHTPINAGVYFYRVNKSLKEFLKFHTQQVFHPSWETYVSIRKTLQHARFGLDWTVGQDFLYAVWQEKQWVEKTFGVRVVDVGPGYNYCPDTDGGRCAQGLIEARKAYAAQEVKVLHLKSKLKELVYSGLLKYAVVRHPRGVSNWLTH